METILSFTYSVRVFPHKSNLQFSALIASVSVNNLTK